MAFKPSDYNLKVVIGIPFSGRYVSPEWAIGLASLQKPMNIRYSFAPVNCARQDPKMSREEAREHIVEVALQHKSQYVLMLDDDVQPPPDILTALIRELDSRSDEYAAIGAIYCSRATQPEPVVFKESAMGAFWRWKKGDIFECAEIGTGCLLIRTDVFRRIPKPWFRDLTDGPAAVAADKSFSGVTTDFAQQTDDIYFCRLLARHDYKLLAHGGALCIHWGRKGDYYELPPTSYPLVPPAEIDPRVESAMHIQGWMTHDELKWLASQAETHTEIVEIGSWMGRSARTLAENTRGRVLCVDTWHGSEEHIAELGGDCGDRLWDGFRFNMLGCDNIHALRERSPDAIRSLPPDMMFDMIFIDGDHAYEAVAADIREWSRKLAPGGILCGHDYTEGWEGVRRAVDELLPGRKVVEGTSIWYVEHANAAATAAPTATAAD